MTSPSPFRRRALAAGLACAALAAAVPAAPAVAGTAPSDSAWVVVRKPARAGYTPAAADRSNSAGGAITVTKVGLADWEIRIPNQGTLATANGGHLQVTPMGSTAATCAIASWGSVGADIVAGVRCSSVASGTVLVTPFVVGYVYEDYDAGVLPTFGYAWLNDPSAATSTPSPTYQHDVAGGTVTATRQAAGANRIIFPNISAGTYVGVTPYNSLTRCRTMGWYPDAGQTVETFCGGSTGLDVPLTVYVANQTGPLGFGRAGATAWVSDPTAARSRPPRAYRWSSNGKSPLITRSGTGVYTVRFPGQAAGGAAFVTAYGTTDRVCQVGSIAKRGTTATVGVRCFRGNGRPADSRFTIGWAR